MAEVKQSKISLKLLIDTRKKKVLFAEASKDFVDFMFSLLTLPVGSVIKLLSPRSMTGCIAKLYQSVEKLNETYLLPNKNKETLLQPKILSPDGVSPLLLGSAVGGSQSNITYYRCGRCNETVTTSRNTTCPTCRSAMTNEMSFVMPTAAAGVGTVEGEEGGGGGGYVRGVVTYMVTDDLEVTPMSAISSITLINKYGSVKKDGVELEEKVVFVGMEEVNLISLLGFLLYVLAELY